MTGFFQILVYGYGNPGREDDGLGIELVKKLESWSATRGIENITFDSNYQLNIEDAEIISAKDIVIFADASTEEEIEDFAVTEVTGETDVAFTTHAASPGYIVKLCNELFGKFPETYLVHIKGYQWGFREGISAKGKENLEKACDFVIEFILNLSDKKSKTKI